MFVKILEAACHAGFRHVVSPKKPSSEAFESDVALRQSPWAIPAARAGGSFRARSTSSVTSGGPFRPHLGLTSPAIANHNGVVMTTEPIREDGSSPGAAKKGVSGHDGRFLAWVVGGLLCVAGVVTTVPNAIHHRYGIGPYLLAAGLLFLLVAALDMCRVERIGARRATRTIRRLAARVDRLEDDRRHLEQDRDQWSRMQGEEAAINRRLAQRIQRVQRPRVSGGSASVATSSRPIPPIAARGEYPTPASPPRVQRPRPRHQVRRPADNQPALFDQDDDRWS
jgi:hypothetical protein